MVRLIGFVIALAVGSGQAASPDTSVLAVAGRANANPSNRADGSTNHAARHPVLALGSGGDLVVAWDEPAGGRRRIGMAYGTVDENGTGRFVRRMVEEAGSATYPAVAMTNDGPVLAWTSGAPNTLSTIRVSRVRF